MPTTDRDYDYARMIAELLPRSTCDCSGCEDSAVTHSRRIIAALLNAGWLETRSAERLRNDNRVSWMEFNAMRLDIETLRGLLSEQNKQLEAYAVLLTAAEAMAEADELHTDALTRRTQALRAAVQACRDAA